MATITSSALSERELAILRAVAAERCTMERRGSALAVDGLPCAHQFTGRRLVSAGLIAPTATGLIRLTRAGRAAIAALAG